MVMEGRVWLVSPISFIILDTGTSLFESRCCAACSGNVDASALISRLLCGGETFDSVGLIYSLLQANLLLPVTRVLPFLGIWIMEMIESFGGAESIYFKLMPCLVTHFYVPIGKSVRLVRRSHSRHSSHPEA